MTTRETLRAQVRAELNDGGAAQLWPDERLNQWLTEAMRDYSRKLPREATAQLSSVANQAEYALPVETLRVVRVEHPQGVPRVRDGDGAEMLGYEVFAGQLVLVPAPARSGDSISVRYQAVYVEPASDAETLATPERDDQLLVWYVCGRALDWISTDEAKRQRFERQRGASAAAEAERYQERYQEAVAQRLRPLRSFRLMARGP